MSDRPQRKEPLGPIAANALIDEIIDLKKKLRESEFLRKGLVGDAAERILIHVAATDRLDEYETIIQLARKLRDPDNGSIVIENLLHFFDALDRIPVPS